MDLTSWFVDSITVHPISGRTEHGDLQYGSSYSVPCRIEKGRRRKILADGATEVSAIVIWADQLLDETMHVNLPGDGAGVRRVPHLTESTHDKRDGYTLYRIEVV